SLSAITRASVSSELPGPAATTNLIGLSGQVCASAGTHAQSATARASSLRRRMTHRLDVVTVRIEHERAVVVGMVVHPQPRSAVVAASCGDRRAVKRIDLCARIGAKGDVQGWHARVAF